MRIAYSPDLGVYPVDPRVAAGRRGRARGASGRGRASSRRWSIEHPARTSGAGRPVVPDDRARSTSTRSRPSRRHGIDLLGDHRDDFPPEYLRWMDAGAGHHARTTSPRPGDALRGLRRAAGRARRPRPARLADARLPAGGERRPTATRSGPTEIDGEPVDPLIGWCMTYFTNFTGHPAASVPAGFADGLPVGLQIIGRRHADADVLAARRRSSASGRGSTATPAAASALSSRPSPPARADGRRRRPLDALGAGRRAARWRARLPAGVPSREPRVPHRAVARRSREAGS